MAEWIYFLHVPREDFAATMTTDEVRVWQIHSERLKRLLDEGSLLLAGPTLGRINTGVVVFEAPDEAAARRIMEEIGIADNRRVQGLGAQQKAALLEQLGK